MKILTSNEIAFVAGGEDEGSCPAAGPGGGCFAPPPSGCTTTTPNGPQIILGASIGANPSVNFSITFAPSSTTCPSPAPGGGGSSGGGGSYSDWLQNTGPMVSADSGYERYRGV